MAEFTKADAVRKANAIKKANPDFPPAKIKAIIEKQNGPLVFNGEPFYFKPTGSGSLAIESVAVRNARKRRSNTARNQQIRQKTPKRQEFINEAKKFFDENNITRLDGKTARQYGISQYQQAKEALKNKKLRIKEAGLTAGHIDPAVGGETLERTGNYFGEPGPQNFTNRNRKPGSRTAKALQVQLPREEAIQRTMGFGQDLPEFTDEQIDATLKGKGQRLGGVSQTTRLPPVADTVKPSLLSQFSPEQQIDDLLTKFEDLKKRAVKLTQQGARFVGDLKSVSQQAVDVKSQRMMDPQKRMPIDPKLMGPGGLAKQAVKEIAEEAISVGLQSLVNQVTKIPNKPRFKK